MADIAGFPYYEVEFTKDGKIFDQHQAGQILDAVAAGTITDLFVVSHGWNNDMAEARSLYRELFARVRTALGSGTPAGLAGRQFAVLGIFWPSKRFADSELIPSGFAASVHDTAAQNAVLQNELENLKGENGFDHPDADRKLEEAKALVPRLETSTDAQNRFVDIMRELFPGGDDLEEKIPGQFMRDPGSDILTRLKDPLAGEDDLVAPEAGTGRATSMGGISLRPPSDGEAAGLGDFLNGIKQGARNLLNFTTYYTMKKRAGTVGGNGVNALLRALREKKGDLKIHLIGHSFGGRLVTSAVNGAAGRDQLKVNTMTLLQAAFSHNGFSDDYDGKGARGFFHGVVQNGNVTGPILISHSVHDKAVGIAYPLASRIVGESASMLGDASDLFGGIGRNGAQHTRQRVVGNLLPAGGSYQFQGGRLYNLNAERFIKGHSDICKPEVAHAILCAVATS